MSHTITIRNKSLAIPYVHLDELQKRLLSTYKKEGKSRECINLLNTLTKEYYQQLQSTKFYNYDFKHLIADAAECKQYHAYCLQDNDRIKVSVHILPKGTEIAAQTCRDTFSLAIVEYGTFRIKQNNNYKLLCKGDTCVGLPINNNTHLIKAMSDVVVFLSIEICYKDVAKRNIISRLFSNRFIAPVFCLLIPFISQPTAQANDFVETTNSNITKQQAECYRKSDNYVYQVDAVEWYLKSAQKGDAESQYWLGVMHLDGNGITEDEDEAFKWIGLAADQGHRPAVKLLAHMIDNDLELDC